MVGCFVASAVIAVDNTHLYWANNGRFRVTKVSTTIGRAELDGTGVNRSFITGASDPCGPAIYQGHLYWGNQGHGESDGTTIGRANIDGTKANQHFITGAQAPCGIAIG